MIVLVLFGICIAGLHSTNLRGSLQQEETREDDIYPYLAKALTYEPRPWKSWRGLSYDDIANSGSSPNNPYFDWVEYSAWLASQTPNPSVAATQEPTESAIVVPYDITPVVNKHTSEPSVSPTTMCPTPVPTLTITLCPTPCPSMQLATAVADATTPCPTPCPSDNPFSLQPVAAVGAGHVIRTPTTVATTYYEVATITRLDSHGDVLSAFTTVTTHDNEDQIPHNNNTSSTSAKTVAPSMAPTGIHEVSPPIEPPPPPKVFKCEPRIRAHRRLRGQGGPASIVLNHSEWAASMFYMTSIGASPADVGYLWGPAEPSETSPEALSPTQTKVSSTAVGGTRRTRRNPSLRGTPKFDDYGH